MNAYRMVNRAPIVGALALLIALQVWPKSPGALAANGHLAGGNVMPAGASPSGYCLDDVAAALAKFSDRGNDTTLLPPTPFQVIYDNGSDVFNVKTGTRLFVPLLFIDDSPPEIGIYPSEESDLASYYFDPTQIGIEGAQIEVDGEVTDIGPDYIGAVFDAALPNGGSNYSELGVFLTPLNKGTHTITIRGTFAGDLVLDLFGFPIPFELTYTVNVK
jgi:hypothetical protein